MNYVPANLNQQQPAVSIRIGKMGSRLVITGNLAGSNPRLWSGKQEIAPTLEIRWFVRGQGGTHRGQRTSRCELRILEPAGDTRWANWATNWEFQFARYSSRKPILRQALEMVAGVRFELTTFGL